ncbi:MAG: hypothetical protein ACFFA0_01325 [Promethearchaeota archaeon]
MPFPKPRRLSKRKIRKSITIPEYLDEWIDRYLKYEREKQKHEGKQLSDETKSYSSFTTKVLENIMNLFLKGKTFEDLELAVDTKVKSFYEKITFRALIVYYELIVRINKYIKLDLTKMLNVFMLYQNFFTGGKSVDEEEAVITLNRFRNFMMRNNITKDVTIEPSGNKYIFQYFGIYPEMHYDFSKFIAGVFGFMGMKIDRASHSNNYTRIDFERTELFKLSEAALEERKKLFEYNTAYFTNFNKILEDEDDLHLWIRINSSKLPIISFKSIDDGLILLREIIDDLNKWIPPREFKIKLLELFKKFRWINLIDESKFTFQLLIKKHSTEYNILKIIFDELKLEYEEFDNSMYLK